MTAQIQSMVKQGLKIFYRENSIDKEVIDEIFDNDIYLQRVPEYRPKASDVIIDIGAHIGTFSMKMSPKVSKVFAFEASRETFELLKKNVEANHLDNVKVYHCAVAKSTGTAILYHDLELGNWGHSITAELSSSSEQVPSISLNDFIEQEQLMKIDYIKFNCEGAEFDIIHNTKPEYLKRVSVMALLWHENLVAGSSHKHLMKYLSQLGFHCVLRFNYKESQNGWITAYRAGFTENIRIKLSALPFTINLFLAELKRKVNRVFAIVRGKK